MLAVVNFRVRLASTSTESRINSVGAVGGGLREDGIVAWSSCNGLEAALIAGRERKAIRMRT